MDPIDEMVGVLTGKPAAPAQPDRPRRGRRVWRGLTQQERDELLEWVHPDIIDTIEAKLKERNT